MTHPSPATAKGHSSLGTVVTEAISVQEVTKVYRSGAVANDRVTFSVAVGEVFGLLGVNGAGKSTIVKQIVGLLRPTSGDIYVCGQLVRPNDRQIAARVGYMPQSAFAMNNLTIAEALYFTAHLRGATSGDARNLRDRVLEKFGLGEIANRYSSQLSGGQARLLQLGIAVVSRQPILVLDEPTNELDPLKRRLVWDYLRHEVRENGTTVLFITHDAIEAERVVDRVGFMRGSRLTVVGKPSELTSLASRPLRVEYSTRLSPEDETAVVAGFARSNRQPDYCVAFVHDEEVSDLINTIPVEARRSLKVTPVTVEELFIDEVGP